MSASPSLLLDLPQLVCDATDVILPDLRRCAPYHGEFTFDELRKMGLPAPAVLVSTLRLKQTRDLSGRFVEFHAGMVAYVITKDRIGAERNSAATAIVQALLQLIPGQCWDSPAVGEARDVIARPAITRETRDAGVTLWLVMWVQPLTFDAFEPEIVPIELYVGQAPKIGAENVDDYDLMGGGA